MKEVVLDVMQSISTTAADSRMTYAVGFTFKRPGHHPKHHAKMGHAEVVLMLQIHKLALICRSGKLLSGRHCQTLL